MLTSKSRRLVQRSVRSVRVSYSTNAAPATAAENTTPAQNPKSTKLNTPNLFSILQGTYTPTNVLQTTENVPASQPMTMADPDLKRGAKDPLYLDMKSQKALASKVGKTYTSQASTAEQIRERVKMYNQMLSRQPATLTVQFTERRTNSFVNFFLGREPRMSLIGGYSLGRLLQVTHKQRRTPQNTKIFVENIMRRYFPRYMLMSKAIVFNIRISGTRKISRTLLTEIRALLQEQMKEVRETGQLSHPLWTLGSIKNVTPIDMGSHKKRKRWRHL